MINVLTVDDVDYLVSPRGNTQWVAQCPGGRRSRSGTALASSPHVRAIEVADAAKPELLRRYLDRWYWEVKGHIAGLTPDSGDDQLRAAAPSIPVFALAIPADSRSTDRRRPRPRGSAGWWTATTPRPGIRPTRC